MLSWIITEIVIAVMYLINAALYVRARSRGMTRLRHQQFITAFWWSLHCRRGSSSNPAPVPLRVQRSKPQRLKLSKFRCRRTTARQDRGRRRLSDRTGKLKTAHAAMKDGVRRHGEGVWELRGREHRRTGRSRSRVGPGEFLVPPCDPRAIRPSAGHARDFYDRLLARRAAESHTIHRSVSLLFANSAASSGSTIPHPRIPPPFESSGLNDK